MSQKGGELTGLAYTGSTKWHVIFIFGNYVVAYFNSECECTQPFLHVLLRIMDFQKKNITWDCVRFAYLFNLELELLNLRLEIRKATFFSGVGVASFQL